MADGISYDNNTECCDFRVFYVLSILITKHGSDVTVPVFAIVILWDLALFLQASTSFTVMNFGVMSLKVSISKYFNYFIS